jgi:hypothetical protein
MAPFSFRSPTVVNGSGAVGALDMIFGLAVVA